MATIVKYNNSTVATLEVGSSATLNCKDKKMASNLTVIENNVPTEVPVYEGAVIFEEEVKMISFTIDGTEYQAESGMTWAEWCESDYNTGGWYTDDDDVGKWGGTGYSWAISTTDLIADRVSSSDVIISNFAYKAANASGGSN